MQLDQIRSPEGLSVDGVGAVFGEPREDVVDVEDGASDGADGGFEGLEGEGAEVEGETFESGVGGVRFGETGAGVGGVCIFGSPLAVGDLRERSESSRTNERAGMLT